MKVFCTITGSFDFETFLWAANRNLIEFYGLHGLELLVSLGVSVRMTIQQSLDLSSSKNLREFDAATCNDLVEI